MKCGPCGNDDRVSRKPSRPTRPVDVPAATVTVGAKADLLTSRVSVRDVEWVAGPVDGRLLGQTSAHGQPRRCRVDGRDVVWEEPTRRVAPGQSIVLYEGDEVVGSGQVA